MTTQILNLPINIPWKQIAVSPDMMDTKFSDKRFPFAWRSSMAISAYEPKLEDLPEELCNERITYLKITCSITGYQPSKEETVKGYVSFPNIPTEELERIFQGYFACYGVLLNVAVFPVRRIILGTQATLDTNVELESYPHIIDFEPKVRDLYQAATETGEVLTGSKSGVNTDKTFAHVESTEDTFGYGTKVTVPVAPGVNGEVSGNISRTITDSDENHWTVQTDASRERRETQGTTTQLSQMYNILTGYHQGTNRAAFLMLPRPHVLQPTDHRTFVQGLRYIEGVQEFMLIVVRPKEIEGLCLDVFLETGHFPEDVDIVEPAAEYYESHEEFITKAFADNGNLSGDCTDIESDQSAQYTIEPGWVIDRSRGDPGHPGIKEIANDSNGQANDSLERYNYKPISEVAVQVSGRICGENLQRDKARFNRTYRVFTRSVQPKPSSSGTRVATPFLKTSRGLYVCFQSGKVCPEVVPVQLAPDDQVAFRESIVDEKSVKLNPALLTREATRVSRLPAMKELLRQIQSAMTTSWRLPTRYPAGQVGYLESDYFKDQIKKALPKENLETPLSKVSGPSEQVLKSIGEKATVGEALEMDLSVFARKTGLSIKEAAKARRQLLGLAPDDDTRKTEPKTYPQD